MASKLKNAKFTKTSNDTFPDSEDVVFVSAINATVKCTGQNSVSYLFLDSGNSGVIEVGETIPLVANSDPITDTIRFSWSGVASVEVAWVNGVGSSGGDIVDILTGNVESTDFQEITGVGVKATDKALSVALEFNGTGGKLKGIVVPDSFTISYSGTLRNEVSTIAFEVPTAAGANGFQRVLVSYTKK